MSDPNGSTPEGQISTISPEDIESRQFQVSLRGYDVDEVRGFLAMVAESFRAVAESRPSAPAAAPAPTVSGGQLSIGEEVNRVLQAAAQAAEELQAKAHRRGAELQAQAQAEAEQARQAAQEEAEAARQALQAEIDAARR